MPLNKLKAEIKTIQNEKQQGFVDLIGINADLYNIKPKIYYFENHPNYIKNISGYSESIKNDLEKIIINCNSEIIDSFDNNECFEMKVDIRNDTQLSQFLQYLYHTYTFSEEALSRIQYFLNMKSSVENDLSNFNSPLYFFGHKRNIKEIICCKVYFKTTLEDNAENTDIYDNDYFINYIRKLNDGKLNYLCEIADEIVKNSLGNIHCIGFDNFADGSIKYKIYFRPNQFKYDSFLNILKCNQILDINSLCENLKIIQSYMSQFEDLAVDFFALASSEEYKLSVNMYYAFPKQTQQKHYFVKDNLITRNIGGVNFIVDICEKNYYTSKELYTINETGKVIFDIMSKYGVSTIEKILNELKKKIDNNGSNIDALIRRDINDFVESLRKTGYVQCYESILGDNE